MTSRRAFLLGLTSALAAPAIVRADSLMKLWVPAKVPLTEAALEQALFNLPLSPVGSVLYFVGRHHVIASAGTWVKTEDDYSSFYVRVA